MRILLLTDRFLPEISAPCFRAMEHARVWLREGHEVTIVTCAPNSPRGVLFPGYRNLPFQEEWLDGVRVIRVWSYMTANQGVIKRTLDYMSFMVSVLLQYRRLGEFDVILASSPTFFTAVAGYVLSMFCRRPWIFEVRDLWPASVRAVGASDSGLLRWVEKLELYLYRDADRIVSVGNAIKRDLVERGIEADKVDVVTNAVDLDQFDASRSGLDARAALGVGPDRFLTGYVGTTGMAHGLTTLLEAAERLRDDDRVLFLIMGDGAERASLEQEARRRGIDNLLFRDPVPHDQMPSYLSAMDLAIVHLRPDPVFRTAIPSKTFEMMAMGVPILMGVEGEAAEIVTEAGAGECVPPGDAAAMAGAVRRLAADPEALRGMGQRGLAAARTRYNRVSRALAELESLRRASTAPPV